MNYFSNTPSVLKEKQEFFDLATLPISVWRNDFMLRNDKYRLVCTFNP